MKNENKQDNRVENLEWCTEQYNCNYGNRNKKLSKSKYKAINQYSLNGDLIREWESGISIEKETGFNITSHTLEFHGICPECLKNVK